MHGFNSAGSIYFVILFYMGKCVKDRTSFTKSIFINELNFNSEVRQKPWWTTLKICCFVFVLCYLSESPFKIFCLWPVL